MERKWKHKHELKFKLNVPESLWYSKDKRKKKNEVVEVAKSKIIESKEEEKGRWRYRQEEWH